MPGWDVYMIRRRTARGTCIAPRRRAEMVLTEARHRLGTARHKLGAAVQSAVVRTITEHAVDYVEPQIANAAVGTGVAGIAGAALMFVGDLLLYGPAAWGETGSTYFAQVDPVSSDPKMLAGSVMGAGSITQIIAGGVLGPLAAILYLVGCLQMLLPTLPTKADEWTWGRFRWGLLACGGHAAAMVTVGAYHAAFAYTGFIARLAVAGPADLSAAAQGQGGKTAGDTTHNHFILVAPLIEAHMTYMRTLKLLITLFGVLGTFGLVAICFSPNSSSDVCLDSTPPPPRLYPRRLLALTPTFWLFLVRETGWLRWLPAPYGLILAGGSFNLCFGAFFSASTLCAMNFRRQLAEAKTAEGRAHTQPPPPPPQQPPKQ